MISKKEMWKDDGTSNIVEKADGSIYPAPLVFRAEDYWDAIEDLNLTDEQKEDFLRTLWSIMSAFVELGFGVDSVIPILAQKASESGADALQEENPARAFNVAANDPAKETE